MLACISVAHVHGQVCQRVGFSPRLSLVSTHCEHCINETPLSKTRVKLNKSIVSIVRRRGKDFPSVHYVLRNLQKIQFQFTYLIKREQPRKTILRRTLVHQRPSADLPVPINVLLPAESRRLERCRLSCRR